MSQQHVINKQRERRRNRVRRAVRGTAERPRLSVNRTLRHISAQVIDDVAGKTLAAASSQQKEAGDSSGKIDMAKVIGKLLAERALAAGVTQVAFDRGHYRYHGRVKALADAAREAGLSF